MRWSHVSFLAGLLVSFGLWAASGQIDDYVVGVLVLVGINIILATSLNLINGHTGQFSLGHAGFMAVGGFAAAKLTVLTSEACFPLSLLLGGVVAALAGLVVGVPSLRLRGDYLAIVTSGFGEII